MSETKCLICNSRSAPNLSNPKTSNILTNQLSAIFLLRNVFELPSWILQKYLVSSGGDHNPSQWISVCTQCEPIVRKTRTFYDQFLEADRKFRSAKYKLVRKMKDSLPPGFTNCGSISEECRQLVQLHDYAEPPKNPFRKGDHLAREMLGVAVATGFDVDNLTVKKEVFESTEENPMEVANLPELYHPTDADLGCSQDLPLTPEGFSHDHDDSDGGGGYHDYNDNDDDDDYAYRRPGPKCRKREAKSKSSKTMAKNDTDPDPDEIPAAEASNLFQFLTTSHGRRLVRYEGYNFYNSGHKTSSTGEIHFYCKWRRDGCLARIGLKNYNEEDATFTGFIPNSCPHDHSAQRNETDRAKHAIFYEVNSLAKEIVKDNLNTPVDQVLQMVLDSFMGDVVVSEELSKESVQTNLGRLIRNTKRKLGWKPDKVRRSFIRKKIKSGETDGVTDQALAVQSHSEVKNDLIPSQKDMEELTSAQASSLIQFLTTSHGKRMVRYDGHNFYHGGHKPSSTGETHLYCKWRRHGCPARISLRNYNDEETSYTGFIPNLAPHSHSAEVQEKTRQGIWYEVNTLAKEIVKDNVNAPVGQVLQMLQDSFMGDPDVTEELSKDNVQRNLRRVIYNMKRRLGWKPDTVRAKRMRARKRQGVARARAKVNNDNKPPVGNDVLQLN